MNLRIKLAAQKEECATEGSKLEAQRDYVSSTGMLSTVPQREEVQSGWRPAQASLCQQSCTAAWQRKQLLETVMARGRYRLKGDVNVVCNKTAECDGQGAAKYFQLLRALRCDLYNAKFKMKFKMLKVCGSVSLYAEFQTVLVAKS
jgi:hypothetical protein